MNKHFVILKKRPPRVIANHLREFASNLEKYKAVQFLSVYEDGS